MKDKMEQLTKPLPLEEIELRIGSVSQQKGFSLLAYKNSRVDVKRFNEVFGAKWYPKYHYDDKGLLVCTIYVYDDDIQQWIGREDVGIESYTEKEKGSYSDALKRAGFRWGVGIELYKMPFIWIKWDNWKEYKGKWKPVVYLDEWKLKQNEELGYYVLDNHGNVVWQQSGGYYKPEPEPEPKPKPQTDNHKYAPKNDNELEELRQILQTTVVNMKQEKMLKEKSAKDLINKIKKINNIALMKYTQLQIETIEALYHVKDKLSEDETKAYSHKIYSAKTKELKEIKTELEGIKKDALT
jgi:hypothetical protein